MDTLSSFPILDGPLVLKLRPQFSPFRFFYKDENGEEKDLVAEDTGSSIHPLSDEHGRWSSDDHGLGFTRTCSIRCASFLYGKAGVACHDAVLTLALLWKSPDSRQRSALEIGEILDSPEVQSFSFREYFPKPRFKGRLDLQTAIVIKKPGSPGEGEEQFANIAGTVLGIIDTFSVLFDGHGSSFPVMVVTDKGGLLWSIKCDFEDPLVDPFDEFVAINLNSAHKDFKYINPKDKKFNPSFLREVLAGALSNIVDYIRETTWWDEIKNGKGEEGSVAKAVDYFATTLNLNLDDPRQTSIAFRDYIDKHLGEL